MCFLVPNKPTFPLDKLRVLIFPASIKEMPHTYRIPYTSQKSGKWVDFHFPADGMLFGWFLGKNCPIGFSCCSNTEAFWWSFSFDWDCLASTALYQAQPASLAVEVWSTGPKGWRSEKNDDSWCSIVVGPCLVLVDFNSKSLKSQITRYPPQHWYHGKCLRGRCTCCRLDTSVETWISLQLSHYGTMKPGEADTYDLPPHHGAPVVFWPVQCQNAGATSEAFRHQVDRYFQNTFLRFFVQIILAWSCMKFGFDHAVPFELWFPTCCIPSW